MSATTAELQARRRIAYAAVFAAGQAGVHCERLLSAAERQLATLDGHILDARESVREAAQELPPMDETIVHFERTTSRVYDVMREGIANLKRQLTELYVEHRRAIDVWCEARGACERDATKETTP